MLISNIIEWILQTRESDLTKVTFGASVRSNGDMK